MVDVLNDLLTVLDSTLRPVESAFVPLRPASL